MLDVENMESTGAIPKRGTLKPSSQSKVDDTPEDEEEKEDGGHLAELGDDWVTVQNPRAFWSTQVCLRELSVSLKF